MTSEYEMYLLFAVFSSVLFLLKLIFMLLGTHQDIDMIDADEAFQVFSLQSILAFLMGFGWGGLALQFEFHWHSHTAFCGALFFGILIGALSCLMMYMVKKLNHTTPQHAPEVGAIGKVYVKIPNNRLLGKGQVEITVGGTKRIVDAVTTSFEALPSFSKIKVTAVHSKYLVTVEKL